MSKALFAVELDAERKENERVYVKEKKFNEEIDCRINWIKCKPHVKMFVLQYKQKFSFQKDYK